jgi:hypothetical protein
MEPTYRPWGKIFIIVLLSAGVMGVFVWKYLDTLEDSEAGVVGHVPQVIMPLYDIFGEALFLIIGAVAALLFLVGGLRAVAGRPSIDD